MAYELALQSVSQTEQLLAVIGMYNKDDIRYEIIKIFSDQIQNI